MYPLPDFDTHRAPLPPIATVQYAAAAVTPPAPVLKAPVQQASSATPPPRQLNLSGPVRLLYDVLGEDKNRYTANGTLLWQPLGAQYRASLEFSVFGLRLRSWTSKGTLYEGGLQPVQFGDKPRGDEQTTTFQRSKGIITFSENTLEVPLQSGAQDKLSALLQLSAMVASEPVRYPAGATISFQAADAHRAELWTFKVGATEPLDLPGGTLGTTKLTKEPTVEFDQRIEVWLAPTLQYLPARLRITEANGAVADLLWRKTQKTD